MTTQFNQQAFEDKIYELATTEVNAVLPELVKNGGDVLEFQRQFLQAIHFAVEESVVQILYGIKLVTQAQANKEGQ